MALPGLSRRVRGFPASGEGPYFRRIADDPVKTCGDTGRARGQFDQEHLQVGAGHEVTVFTWPGRRSEWTKGIEPSEKFVKMSRMQGGEGGKFRKGTLFHMWNLKKIPFLRPSGGGFHLTKSAVCRNILVIKRRFPCGTALSQDAIAVGSTHFSFAFLKRKRASRSSGRRPF
jgi:hypothetical protein